MDEPLFSNAQAALAFAFNFSLQQYDRPLMNKLADGPGIRTGRGLSGNDGAGQAGILRRHVATLTHLQQAVLVARFAPAQLDCSCGAACCSEKMVNFEWQAALRLLADDGERVALAGCTVNRHMTLKLLRKLIGHKLRVGDIGREAGVTEKTASHHFSKLKVWFHGEKEGHNGEPPQRGIDQIAMAAAETALGNAGLISTAGELN